MLTRTKLFTAILIDIFFFFQFTKILVLDWNVGFFILKKITIVWRDVASRVKTKIDYRIWALSWWLLGKKKSWRLEINIINTFFFTAYSFMYVTKKKTFLGNFNTFIETYYTLNIILSISFIILIKILIITKKKKHQINTWRALKSTWLK